MRAPPRGESLGCYCRSAWPKTDGVLASTTQFSSCEGSQRCTLQMSVGAVESGKAADASAETPAHPNLCVFKTLLIELLSRCSLFRRISSSCYLHESCCASNCSCAHLFRSLSPSLSLHRCSPASPRLFSVLPCYALALQTATYASVCLRAWVTDQCLQYARVRTSK